MAMLVEPGMCPKVCSFLAIDPPLHFLSFGVSFLVPFSVVWGHSQWCSGDYVGWGIEPGQECLGLVVPCGVP